MQPIPQVSSRALPNERIGAPATGRFRVSETFKPVTRYWEQIIRPHRRSESILVVGQLSEGASSFDECRRYHSR
jgi:hypothetical protein